MSKSARPYKRSVYVVKKSLQYRLIFWTVGAVLVAALVVLLDVSIALHIHAVREGLAVRVSDLYDPTNPLTLLKLIIYIAGVFYASVLLSHRVAGPVYRFEKSAESVSQGDLTHKVFLRQRDEFPEFRDAFNVMVDSLRGKVAGDVACAFRARKQLEALLEAQETLPEGVVDRVKKAMADLDRVGKEFKI